MKRKSGKLKKEILSYTVFFEPAEEGGYVVTVPALPGCVTQGEDLKEAIEMAQDAIQLYLATEKDLGQELPVESLNTIVLRLPAEAIA